MDSRAAEELQRVRASQSPALLLTGYGLRHFPAEICEMTWLEQLDLSRNLITSLPEGIGKLQRLDALYVQNNRLVKLPDAFTSMNHVRFVNLDGNALNALPDSLNRLERLATLSVSQNRLTSLPTTITERTLRALHGLETNPLDDALRPILKTGAEAVIAYLNSLSSGSEQYEAKLVFIGEGDVGKSSLLAALMGEPFVENRSTTHGIEIARLRLPLPSDMQRQLTLNCWDFGGQEVYRISHQFFFSRRSLYLIIWNARQGHEANDVEGWLTRLRLRVGTDARMLIVATHSDERRAEIDYGSLQRTYGDALTGHLEVDSKSSHGLPALRSKIALEAAELPQMGTLLSTRWITVRESLTRLQEAYVSYEAYERICTEHGLEGAEHAALAALLHDLGAVIHYAEDEGLRDLIVLQPEWLTKAIGFVLEDEETRSRGGVLAHSRLSNIWGETGLIDYPRALYPYFLRLMEKFDVSYRLPDEESSLVAQLVPHERPVPAHPFHTHEHASEVGRNAPVAGSKVQDGRRGPGPGLVAYRAKPSILDRSSLAARRGVGV